MIVLGRFKFERRLTANLPAGMRVPANEGELP